MVGVREDGKHIAKKGLVRIASQCVLLDDIERATRVINGDAARVGDGAHDQPHVPAARLAARWPPSRRRPPRQRVDMALRVAILISLSERHHI